MPRNARLVVPGLPHHVTQRGHQRRQIFFTDDDSRLYLSLWQEIAGKYGRRVRAYGLMSNHVHVVPVPATHDALARAIGLIDQCYRQWLNLREGTTGHRGQHRCASNPLDDTYETNVLRYVERNAARARIVQQPWDYPWRSARAHLHGDAHPLLRDCFTCPRHRLAGLFRAWLRWSFFRVCPHTLTNLRLARHERSSAIRQRLLLKQSLTPCPPAAACAPGPAWGAWFCDTTQEAQAAMARLRANTLTGSPTGSDVCIARLEAQSGRRLHRERAGRKKSKGII